MLKKTKANLEFLPVKAELKGASEEAGAMSGADLPRIIPAWRGRGVTGGEGEHS